MGNVLLHRIIMTKKKKNLFYFPTWTLVFFCISLLAVTVFDMFLIFNLDSIQKITVSGVEYSKDSQEYLVAIKKMKQAIVVSATLTLLLSIIAGWFVYRRRNK